MNTVSVKEARMRLAKLINAAQRGRGVAITRRGKTVAQLVPPPQPRQRGLPDLAAFRKTVKLRGASLSKTILTQRRQERY